MSMSAKELHDEYENMGMAALVDPEARAITLRALSLLAAVEDGDEIARELQECVVHGDVTGEILFIRYEILDKAAARITRDAQEIAALKGELERERMRLCACGVVAMANTPESAAKARQMPDDYRSSSLSDVERAVDAEMALRGELASVKAELQNIAEADYRKWDPEMRDPQSFVDWAKSRARHALAAHPKE